MPLDRPVAFMGMDEVQLCADPERGHIFTERLLHARGMDEPCSWAPTPSSR